MVDAYEVLVSSSEEAADRVERLVAIRSIYEERLGKLDLAFSAAVRAYRQMPNNGDLLAGLERLGRSSGSVETLLEVLEDQAEELPLGGALRADLRLRVGRYAETLLQDRGRAVEAYRRALEEAPDSEVVMLDLDRVYRDSGQHRERVEILRQMAALHEDVEPRVERLSLAAQLLEEQLGDRASAAAVYEQVLALQPGAKHALERLDELYEAARADEDLARVLRSRVEYSEGVEEAGLRLRLGQLELGALENHRGALDAYAGILRLPEIGGAFDGALYGLDDLIETVKERNPALAAEAAEAPAFEDVAGTGHAGQPAAPDPARLCTLEGRPPRARARHDVIRTLSILTEPR